MRLVFAAFALPILLAQSPNSPTIPKINDVNPELLNLVIYDQWDRGNDLFGDHKPAAGDRTDWKDVDKRDQQRRESVRQLLADGKLQTGKDFRFAALIFQHSPDTAGYLLAHVLAVTAVSKGDRSAKWLSAATMDRYLQSLHQPQVFGTQFLKKDGEWTLEPYERNAVSDAVRATWCVVPLADQESALKELREGKPLRRTSLTDCK